MINYPGYIAFACCTNIFGRVHYTLQDFGARHAGFHSFHSTYLGTAATKMVCTSPEPPSTASMLSVPRTSVPQYFNILQNCTVTLRVGGSRSHDSLSRIQCSESSVQLEVQTERHRVIDSSSKVQLVKIIRSPVLCSCHCQPPKTRFG